MRILFVCTANICRSPSAAALLAEAIAGAPDVAAVTSMRSAGTGAQAGSPGCVRAPALATVGAQHRSTLLDAGLLRWADLVLTAEREHRGAAVELDPSARSRTFPLRQAGRIAAWLIDNDMVVAGHQRAELAMSTGSERAWAERIPPGDPRQMVAALPAEAADRVAWLVGELDAGRGFAPQQAPAQAERPRRGRWGRDREAPAPEGHSDDVPDPHVHGMGLHPLVDEQLRAAVAPIAALMTQVARA